MTSIHTDEQKALMASTIQAVGTVQDIVVRHLGEGSYELVAGKGRLLELQAMGVSSYPVKVIQADEKLGLIMNIVENMARGSYDYISVALAIRKLRSMGTSLEELEQIFPWRRRWIEFIEELQDLPQDVVDAIRARKITPTHVQTALDLATPFEVHDGLRTAINLEWDSGTFKTYVQNRVDQIEKAKAEAELEGREPEIPKAEPQVLIQYAQCLVCGYKKPREQVTVQLICESCQNIAKYVNDVVAGEGDAMQIVYQALQLYYGARAPPPLGGEGTRSVGAPA